MVPPPTQLPAPSHVDAAVAVLPLHDAPAPHAVPAAYFWHAPLPGVHAALVPHERAPWSGHAVAQQMPFDPQVPLPQSAPPSAGLQGPPDGTLLAQMLPAQW
jgi:hypothetical protein